MHLFFINDRTLKILKGMILLIKKLLENGKEMHLEK